MPKNLTDNFKNSKWVGTTVKLSPTDKTGSPEDFEKLYDRRRAPRQSPMAPRPKLKEIESTSLQDRLAEFGLDN